MGAAYDGQGETAMTVTPDRSVNIGVLGCGQIAQAGHFDSVTKARNARLHAICDVAGDLVDRFAVTHGAARTYTDYDSMLADPELDAVIIATADAFHVPAALAALAAQRERDAPLPQALAPCSAKAKPPRSNAHAVPPA